EAEQLDRILAHVGVDPQLDLLGALLGDRRQRLQRHVQLPADPVGLDDHHPDRRQPTHHPTPDPADHRRLRSFARATSRLGRRLACTWPIAMARASAASACGTLPSRQSSRTRAWTSALVARPRPTTARLIIAGAYSSTLSPCSSAISLSAPRASASFSALAALSPWKARSIARPAGRNSAMISRTAAPISNSRAPSSSAAR